MSTRLRFVKTSPEGYQALLKLEEYVENCGLELALIRLIQTRASQINGCAFCLDMHTKDARAEGENEQRLYLLPVWREATCYSEREKAALEWTEAVTEIAGKEVSEEVYERARLHFTEVELANLTLAVAAINSWNRLNVAFQTPAGSYRPKQATSH